MLSRLLLTIASRTAGSVFTSPRQLGPTSRMSSMSSDVNDPGFRAVSFDELVAELRD